MIVVHAHTQNLWQKQLQQQPNSPALKAALSSISTFLLLPKTMQLL